MKVGFGIPNNQGVEDPNDLVTLAVTAERLGYSSVWVREHLFHSTYVAERLGDKPYHAGINVCYAPTSIWLGLLDRGDIVIS